MSGTRSLTICAGLLLAALLLSVASAAAATRYAAPGGTGADPCANPGDPCTISVAADQSVPGTTVKAGDLVILAPGDYSDQTEDLGIAQFVNLLPGITVRGEAGKPRPRITIEGAQQAFNVNSGDTVAHLEIVSATANLNIVIFGGVVEDVIVRSSKSNAISCYHVGGVVRDSVCLSSGSSGTALGSSQSGGGPFSPVLRNVTAVATGAGSFGISYAFFAGTSGSIEGQSVIASGTAFDVRARGVGAGGTSNVVLAHSDFDSSTFVPVEGGFATVTEPGTGTNITAAPLFAADGFHVLPASPTVDKGFIAASSGAADIDGQLRTIGTAADIGADELAHATATTLSCAPASVLVATATTCTATVADASSGPISPTGAVALGASAGSFAGACTLAPQSASISTCTATFLAPDAGTKALTAAYPGDGSHDGSGASGSVLVTPLIVAAPSGGTAPGGGGPAIAPATKLGKHPPKSTAKTLSKFVFSADQAGSRFECKLDRKRFRPCRSPFKRVLAPGRHVFKVRAVSPAGSADPTPASFRWKILSD